MRIVMTQIVVLLLYCVGASAAEISINAFNTLDQDGSFECGSDVTLMCKIQPFSGTMAWKADNSTMMSCTSGSCKTHPPYHNNYGFAFERSNGIFNITISPVTFNENGVKFECNDGTTSELLTASVKVLPENSTTVLSRTNGTGASNTTNGTNTAEVTEIHVKTGCVYPADNLQFQWYYFKEGETPVLYTVGQQTDGTANDSSTDCTTGDCGGNGVKQMTSTLTFQQDDAEEEYYLRVVVSSPDVAENIVLTSDTTYKLKVSEDGISTYFKNLGTNVWLFVIIALCGLAVVTITVIIYVVMYTRGIPNPEKTPIVGK